MTTRNNRHVVVSNGDFGVLIGFMWTETNDQGAREQKVVDLHYPRTKVLESVNQALCAFILPAVHIDVIDDVTRVVSRCLDDDPGKFDLVAGAEEPEQAFVSRYVLEG